MLPDALAKDIAEDAVRWDQAQPMAVADFHEKYTLHDSVWIGLHLDTAWDGEATAIIALDTVWNKVSVPSVIS